MGTFNSAISDNWSDGLVELILHLLCLKDVIKCTLLLLQLNLKLAVFCVAEQTATQI